MDEGDALFFAQLVDQQKELRHLLDKMGKEVSNITSNLRALEVAFHGKHGENGLRSEVRELERWRVVKDEEDDALREELRHYRDVERFETCAGLRALAEWEEEANKKRGEDVNIQVARINGEAVKSAAEKEAEASKAVQILTLVGVVLGPFLYKLAEKLFSMLQ